MEIVSLYAVLLVIVSSGGALVGFLFLKRVPASVIAHAVADPTATDAPLQTKRQTAFLGSVLVLFGMAFIGAATRGFARGSWHAFLQQSTCGMVTHYLLGTLLLVLGGALVQIALQPQGVRKGIEPVLCHLGIGKIEAASVLAQASLFFMGAFAGEIGAILYYATPTR